MTNPTKPSADRAGSAKNKVRGRSAVLTYRSGGKNYSVIPEERSFAVGLSTPAALVPLRKSLGKLGRVEFSKPHGIALVECLPGIEPEAVRIPLEKLLAKGTLTFWAPLLRDPKTACLQIPNNEITVRFDPAVKAAAVKKLAAAHGLTVARQNEFVKHQFVLRMEKPAGAAVLHAASSLDREDAVEFAVPNFLSEFRKKS